MIARRQHHGSDQPLHPGDCESIPLGRILRFPSTSLSILAVFETQRDVANALGKGGGFAVDAGV